MIRNNKLFFKIIFLVFLLASSATRLMAYNVHVFYVSSSCGNDNNPGTKELPKKTISSIIDKSRKNLIINLKRGDVFFEKIKSIENVTIDAYGNGEKPILCGFKILKKTVEWKLVGNGIWKLKMATDSIFYGFPSDLATDINTMNNIGCIYDISNDRLYGHLVQSFDKLLCNGDFFTSSVYAKENIDSCTFKDLFFKFEKNPSCLGNIAFSVYESGLFLIKKCCIKNISVVGFAKHGIANMTESRVENCSFDIIGGSVQIGYKNYARYGNGIELYNTSHNDTIINCMISRTYDCGVTIQALGKIIENPYSIYFKNNKFYHCRQALEHFMNPIDTLNNNPQYKNCEFVGNICYEMGENEFCCPQERDANILSHEKSERSFIIENNTFYGSSHYCGYRFAQGMKNNIIYVLKGQYLNHFHAIPNYPTIYAKSKEDILAYRKRSGDNSKIIIVKRGSKKDLRFRKKMERLISYKKPELHLERLLKEY